MGRKGADYKRINVINVYINDHLVQIELNPNETLNRNEFENNQTHLNRNNNQN